MRADGQGQLVGILPVQRFSAIRATFATALMLVRLQPTGLWGTFLGQLNNEIYIRLLAEKATTKMRF
jgi:hypothetical protein